MNKYLPLRQKLELLFSPVMSWTLLKGSDYCQEVT